MADPNPFQTPDTEGDKNYIQLDAKPIVEPEVTEEVTEDTVNQSVQDEQARGEQIKLDEVLAYNEEEALSDTATAIAEYDAQSGTQAPSNVFDEAKAQGQDVPENGAVLLGNDIMSASQAIQSISAANAMVSNATPENIQQARKNALAVLASAGGKYRSAPTEFKSTEEATGGMATQEHLYKTKMQLQAFERINKLGKDYVSVSEDGIDNDVAGATGRRRKKGNQPKYTLQPHEVADVAGKVFALSENPAFGASLSEEQYEAIKPDLATNSFGIKFMRDRNNREITADKEIAKAISTFKNSEEVSAFLTKYDDNLIIKDYVATQVAQGIDDPNIKRLLAIGDKELGDTKRLQAYKSREYNGNSVKFGSWLESQGLTPREAQAEQRKLVAGDAIAVGNYDRFKLRNDHITVSSTGTTTTHSLSSEARARIEKEEATRRSIIRGNIDTTDKGTQARLKANGATQGAIDVVNSKAELNEAFNITGDAAVGRVPPGVNLEDTSNEVVTSLAMQAYGLVKSGEMNAEQAIKQTTKDLDADLTGLMALNNKIANQVIGLAEADVKSTSKSELITEMREGIAVQQTANDVRGRLKDSNPGSNSSFAQKIDELGGAQDGVIRYLAGISVDQPGEMGKLSQAHYNYVKNGLYAAATGDTHAGDYGDIKKLYNDTLSMYKSSQTKNDIEVLKNNAKTEVDIMSSLHSSGLIPPNLPYGAVKQNGNVTTIMNRNNESIKIYSSTTGSEVKHFATSSIQKAYDNLPSTEDRDTMLQMVGGAVNGLYGSGKDPTQVDQLLTVFSGNTDAVSAYMSHPAYRRFVQVSREAADAFTNVDIKRKAGVDIDDKDIEAIKLPDIYKEQMTDPAVSIAFQKFVKSGESKDYATAITRAHYLSAQSLKTDYNTNKSSAVNKMNNVAKLLNIAGKTETIDDPAKLTNAMSNYIDNLTDEEEVELISNWSRIKAEVKLINRDRKLIKKSISTMNEDLLEPTEGTKNSFTEKEVQQEQQIKLFVSLIETKIDNIVYSPMLDETIYPI